MSASESAPTVPKKSRSKGPKTATKPPKLPKSPKPTKKRKGGKTPLLDTAAVSSDESLTMPTVYPLRPSTVRPVHYRMFDYEFKRDRWHKFDMARMAQESKASHDRGAGRWSTTAATTRHVSLRGGVGHLNSAVMKTNWRQCRVSTSVDEQRQLTALCRAIQSTYFYPVLPLYCVSRQLLHSCRTELFWESPDQPLLLRIFHGPKDDPAAQYVVQEVLLAPLQHAEPISLRTTNVPVASIPVSAPKPALDEHKTAVDMDDFGPRLPTRTVLY